MNATLIRENFPTSLEWNGKGRLADFVAKKAGFKSRKEYEAASRVIEYGVPELVAAMDAYEVSISAAAEVSRLPPDAQRAAVAGGRKAVAQAAKRVRESRQKHVISRSPSSPDAAEITGLRADVAYWKARAERAEAALSMRITNGDEP